MTSFSDTPKRAPLALLVQGARPKTLTLSGVPVLVGNALAAADGHPLQLWVTAATLLAAVFIQAATNLYNDALDSLRGVDDHVARLGPPRIVASGWMSARDVLAAAHTALALAFLLGVFLAVRGGWPIVVIGLGSLLAAYTYSAGSEPISARPSGELYVVGFFGIVAVGGSHYLQSRGVSLEALASGLSLGLAAAAVLVVNNYRDLETDRDAGRRTLVVTWGRPAARALYVSLLVLPLVLSASIAISAPDSDWNLLPWLLLPWAVRLSRTLRTRTAATGLNRLLIATVVYHLALGTLLSVGALFGAGPSS